MKLYDFGLTIGVIIFLLAIGYWSIVMGDRKLDTVPSVTTNDHP
jgi:hypothetical protein